MKSGHNVIDAYHFILEYAAAHQGNTPSQRRMAAHCEFAIGTAHTCVAALIKEGLLERIDGDLCVVKADFALHPDAATVPANKGRTASLLDMNVIPRDIQGTNQAELNIMGIDIYGPFNDHFYEASYPLDWQYEKVESDGQETYLLADDEGLYRAVVHYHDKGKNRGVTFTLLGP